MFLIDRLQSIHTGGSGGTATGIEDSPQGDDVDHKDEFVWDYWDRISSIVPHNPRCQIACVVRKFCGFELFSRMYGFQVGTSGDSNAALLITVPCTVLEREIIFL